MTFTEYVREYCKKYGITGYELSKKTGLSITYCYNLLNGKRDNPSYKIINIISFELGIQYANFLYGNMKLEKKEEAKEEVKQDMKEDTKEEEGQSISLDELKKLMENNKGAVK